MWLITSFSPQRNALDSTSHHVVFMVGKKWHQGRFMCDYLGFSLSLSFHQYSVYMLSSHTSSGWWEVLEGCSRDVRHGLMPWECRDCNDEYKDNERMNFSWFVNGNLGVGGSELPLQEQKGGTALSPHFKISNASSLLFNESVHTGWNWMKNA